MSGVFSGPHTSIRMRTKRLFALSPFPMNGVFVIFPNEQDFRVSNESNSPFLRTLKMHFSFMWPK